ncbi:MAG TPA: serine/threonine-protein kinase [Bacilli bacterium]|nr:serine/threonine-protein kinase [Bacilli bacterium]
MSLRQRVTLLGKELYSWFIDRPLRTGRVIAGRYRIEQVLGIGAYGVSYLCRDLDTEHDLVLKQVKPSRRHGAKGRPMYEYETNMLASLDHPSIPKLSAKLEWEGQLFFAMEYMRGPNFEDLIFLEGKRYGEKEALQILSELLDIVAFLHRRGIVHRDVRIPNVILADGRLRLIDFGLARRIGEAPTMEADDLDAYVEEKQIRREVSFTSDFYAMGHFLLFLLYSTYEPEKGHEEGSWEVELKLTEATRGLLRRLLQIEPPFASSEEVRQALEEALTG